MNTRLVLLLACLCVQVGGLQAQQLTSSQNSFLQKQAKMVCTDASLASPNWKPLASELKNKRIVLLGEFNHGSKEVFALRNDLIRYLHEQMGFNVVLLESGIGELALSDLQKHKLSPEQMTYGLFGGWRTKEFQELMAYVKAEEMTIAGFDVQRTGGSFQYLLEEVAGAQQIDSSLYANLEERFGQAQRRLRNRNAVYDSVQLSIQSLTADYENVLNLLSQNEPSKPSKELLLTQQTLSNRIAFLGYMLQFIKDSDWNKRWEARDSAMAANINWLSEHIFNNEKCIVIAHNFHIAKANEKEEVMGEFLHRQHGEELYALGVFAGAGSFANNAGQEEAMQAADATNLDIKHVIGELDGFAHFLPIPHQKKDGIEWLYEEIVVNDTFIDLSGSKTMKLAEHFDGLLLLERVSPPEK